MVRSVVSKRAHCYLVPATGEVGPLVQCFQLLKHQIGQTKMVSLELNSTRKDPKIVPTHLNVQKEGWWQAIVCWFCSLYLLFPFLLFYFLSEYTYELSGGQSVLPEAQGGEEAMTGRVQERKGTGTWEFLKKQGRLRPNCGRQARSPPTSQLPPLSHLTSPHATSSPDYTGAPITGPRKSTFPFGGGIHTSSIPVATVVAFA